MLDGFIVKPHSDDVAGNQAQAIEGQTQMVTYTNPRMNAVIENWPIGSKRTTATFRVESVPGRGQRGTRFTIDPKTGRPSATKTLTYAVQVRIVDGDDGKTYLIERSIYGGISVMQSNMKFQAESLFPTDPRYAEVAALFDVEAV